MYCTNVIRDDGFGSQYQNIMSCILFTEICLSKQFALTQTDFKTVYMDEAYKMHSIMNLESEFKRIEEIAPSSSINAISDSITYPWVYQNIDRCICSNTMDKIRKAFHKKHYSQYALPNNRDEVHVAVHIRRPSNHPNIDLPSHIGGYDVKSNGIDYACKVCCRYSSNDRYTDAMNAIRAKYDACGKPCVFYIVSEGKPDDFASLIREDVKLFINKSVEESFCKLVYADVLVCGFSSFSYAAAMLRTTDQQTWHQRDFWCPPASCWHVF